MRKFISILLIITIICLMPVTAADRQGRAGLSGTSNGDRQIGGFTAALSAVTRKVSVGETVKIRVNVGCKNDIEGFSSGEVIIKFDSTRLVFDKATSDLSGASVAVKDGELVLQDYGEIQDFGTVYLLSFKGKAEGAARLTLTSAAFSTKENAASYDLSPAEIISASETVNIIVGKEVFRVSYDKTLFKGYSSVVKDDDYTFSVSDSGKYYDYGTVSATVNGREVKVIDNKNGTYTVKSVTGNLNITGSRTPKHFEVSIDGETVQNDGTEAIYGTDYKFVLKDSIPPTNQPGVAYSIESITVGGQPYTAYTYDEATRTGVIYGQDIVGDICIKISSASIPVNKYVIAVSGAAGAVDGTYPATADHGSSHTLTLNPAKGKVYSVTATMGGKEVEVVSEAAYTYTVNNITSNVVFNVLEMTPEDNITVSEYLTIDGSTIWLVKNNTEKLQGVVYTVNGENMFWSDKYDAYCFLIESVEAPKIVLGTASEEAVTVDYSMDVDISGSTEIKDAELVYDMYNDEFGGITNDYSVENYLRADLDGSGNISVLDAVAILYTVIE